MLCDTLHLIYLILLGIKPLPKTAAEKPAISTISLLKGCTNQVHIKLTPSLYETESVGIVYVIAPLMQSCDRPKSSMLCCLHFSRYQILNAAITLYFYWYNVTGHL